MGQASIVGSIVNNNQTKKKHFKVFDNLQMDFVDTHHLAKSNAQILTIIIEQKYQFYLHWITVQAFIFTEMNCATFLDN